MKQEFFLRATVGVCRSLLRRGDHICHADGNCFSFALHERIVRRNVNVKDDEKSAANGVKAQEDDDEWQVATGRYYTLFLILCFASTSRFVSSR